VILPYSAAYFIEAVDEDAALEAAKDVHQTHVGYKILGVEAEINEVEG